MSEACFANFIFQGRISLSEVLSCVQSSGKFPGCTYGEWQVTRKVRIIKMGPVVMERVAREVLEKLMENERSMMACRYVKN